MRMEMGYPEFEYEMEILKGGHLHYDQQEAEPVVSRNEVVELQGFVRRIYVEDTVYEYMVRLASATRAEESFRSGVSPRGTLSLKAAAQARALANGRAFVLPEDVDDMLLPVFGHRLALRKPMSDPIEERRSIEGLLTQLLEKTPDPV
jgi:MoxR-like ATPase